MKSLLAAWGSLLCPKMVLLISFTAIYSRAKREERGPVSRTAAVDQASVQKKERELGSFSVLSSLCYLITQLPAAQAMMTSSHNKSEEISAASSQNTINSLTPYVALSIQNKSTTLKKHYIYRRYLITQLPAAQAMMTSSHNKSEDISATSSQNTMNSLTPYVTLPIQNKSTTLKKHDMESIYTVFN